MQVIGHTLLWHQQAPAWLFQDASGKPLSRDEALANLKTHIQTVVTHYKGKVKGWDVVNEAISSGWIGASLLPAITTSASPRRTVSKPSPTLWPPVEQAAVTAMFGPWAPSWMAM